MAEPAPPQDKGPDFPFYDGHDLRLKGPFCLGCCKDYANALFIIGKPPPSKKVSKCARCKFAFYCSRECQKADWPNHKVACRIVANQRKLMDQNYAEIPQALIPIMAGSFYDIPKYFNYVKAKLDLALLLHKPAYDLNAIWIWEEINDHMQECLRLCHLHDVYDYGMRNKFPMFLINVDRDDDAYAFCRYWIRRQGFFFQGRGIQ